MKDNVGQRAPAHRSPRQDPCFDPLIRSPVSRDSRAAASGSFLDWKGLSVGGAFSAEPPAAGGHPRRPSLAAAGCDAGQAGVPLRCSYRRRQRGATRGGPLLVSAHPCTSAGPGSRPGRSKPRHFVVGPSVATEAAALEDDLAPWWWTHKTRLRRRRGSASRSRTTAAPSAARAHGVRPSAAVPPSRAGLTPTRVFLTPRGPPPGNGNPKRDLCGHVKWDPQVLRQNIKFWVLLAKECSWAVGQALPVTVRAGGVKAVSPAERGRSVATRLDAGEHTVMLIGPTARVVDAR